MYDRISFTTKDGVIISGDYYSLPEPKGFVLLLHMMPAVKESWQELAKALNSAGLACLAIDLRGHGESIRKKTGATINYKNFSDKEHQAKILDVRAAVEWLKTKGASENKLAVVGASIGANLSLQYLAESAAVPTAVALSPGINYHGIKTRELAAGLAANKSFMCIASNDDEFSYKTCSELVEKTPAVSENVQLEDAGHGTDMFNEQDQLIEKVVTWVSEKLGA